MGEVFEGKSLRGARFAECDLTDAVIRGSDVTRMEVDAPWLVHSEYFLVNGVDVTAYVESELDRRFPGRALRRAATPAELVEAWRLVESAWAEALARVDALPPGSVDVSVDGEWSFAQTLRHLVHATDIWIGRSVLGRDDEHPIGLGHEESGPSTAERPAASYDEVLGVRADRQAMVRTLIEGSTPESLAERRPHPRNPAHDETVLSCVHVILEEEWEHLRFATRDLDAIERG